MGAHVLALLLKLRSDPVEHWEVGTVAHQAVEFHGVVVMVVEFVVVSVGVLFPAIIAPAVGA